jgi:hypothetical protein
LDRERPAAMLELRGHRPLLLTQIQSRITAAPGALRVDQLMAAAPRSRYASYQHEESDGLTMQRFARALSDALATSPRMAEDLMALRQLSGLTIHSSRRRFVFGFEQQLVVPNAPQALIK